MSDSKYTELQHKQKRATV